MYSEYAMKMKLKSNLNQLIHLQTSIQMNKTSIQMNNASIQMNNAIKLKLKSQKNAK